jgi:hypothetical protein
MVIFDHLGAAQNHPIKMAILTYLKTIIQEGNGHRFFERIKLRNNPCQERVLQVYFDLQPTGFNKLFSTPGFFTFYPQKSLLGNNNFVDFLLFPALSLLPCPAPLRVILK